MMQNLILGNVSLDILTVTWNHAREPQNLDFEALFPDHERYNIIAFGGQESGSEKEEEVALVQSYLGKEYINIGFVGKGEIFLVVFVKEYDCRFMRDACKNYIMKDMLGYGWKGGVMIQFTLYDTIFSFVNCHLESGQNAVDKRLLMAQGILKDIGLFSEKDMIEPDAIADINFFMGDLNFRFNRTYQEHSPHVHQSPELIPQLDQLTAVKRDMCVFPGYEEKQITFMPTYKREKNVNAYVNKNNQCMSYTDRIMVKNNSNCPLTIQEYNAHENYWGSDHRPVFAHVKVVTQPQNFISPTTLLNS